MLANPKIDRLILTNLVFAMQSVKCFPVESLNFCKLS